MEVSADSDFKESARVDLTLRNCTIITAADTFRADIGIDGGKIVAIAKYLEPGIKDIDVEGKWVMPGFIDVHTHFDVYLDPFHMKSPENFETGTRQAACGGVTTIIDYAFQPANGTLHDAVQEWHSKARDRCYIDYGFHSVITNASRETIKEIPEMVEDGYPSFKVFMNHGFGDLSDRQLYDILKWSRESGGIVTAHAENGGIIEARTAELQEQGRTSPKEVPHAMPIDAEGEATSRIITLARVAGNAPVYIVHLSSLDALDAVRLGRKLGQKVYAETRPTYLVLDESYYRRPPEEAVRYMASPPLRPKEHIEGLWNGLRNGDLQTVGSDHTAWDFCCQKDQGIKDFSKMPPGIPAVETMGPLLFTYGVKAGRITPNKLVEILATNPAKLFGLYPRKGSISVGGDADLVVYDPDRPVTISKQLLHGATDYEPYEGVALTGYPVLTFSRGEMVMQEGKLTGRLGHGEWIKRQPFQTL